MQAAFEAASWQAKTLQVEGSNDTMGATRYFAKGKYWRPNLTQNEWTLLNRHMEQEISDSAHTLDESTQWAYAEEKGNRVFAIYGIGDGTEATPLYAVGGKKARTAYEFLMSKMEGVENDIDGNGENVSQWISSIRGNKKYDRHDTNTFGQAGAAAKRADQLHGGTSNSNTEGATGTGNRNGTVKYSLKEYSDQEKRDHRKEAIAYFGKTYNWNETGYLTPAGTKLDFSGRHEGGPGGYRTVDHRDIQDAIGEDYGSETKDIEITGVLQNLYTFNPRICR